MLACAALLRRLLARMPPAAPPLAPYSAEVVLSAALLTVALICGAEIACTVISPPAMAEVSNRLACTSRRSSLLRPKSVPSKALSRSLPMAPATEDVSQPMVLSATDTPPAAPTLPSVSWLVAAVATSSLLALMSEASLARTAMLPPACRLLRSAVARTSPRTRFSLNRPAKAPAMKVGSRLVPVIAADSARLVRLRSLLAAIERLPAWASSVASLTRASVTRLTTLRATARSSAKLATSRLMSSSSGVECALAATRSVALTSMPPACTVADSIDAVVAPPIVLLATLPVAA